MAKFGWDPSQGLGSANNQGSRDHVKVVRKLDASGIGVARATKEGAEIGGAGEGLNSLFARLKKGGSAHEDGSDSSRVSTPMVFDTSDEQQQAGGSSVVASQVEIVAPVPTRALGNMARTKYVKSKRLAASSPAAMAEILGIPVASLPASPSGLSQSSTPIVIAGPSTVGANDKDDRSRTSTSEASDELAEDNLRIIAKISVGEYFRRKLAQKKAQREGKAIPQFGDEPEGYNEVAKEFEGKKITFGADEQDEQSSNEQGQGESADRGVGGAGLGSAGDMNAVHSEAPSPAQGKSSKKSKDKRTRRIKRESKRRLMSKQLLQRS